VHVSAGLGTPRPRFLDKPRRDDQFSFALRADAPAYATARDDADADGAGKDLCRWCAARAHLLDGELPLAGRLVRHAVLPEIGDTARDDYGCRRRIFRRGISTAHQRSTGHHRCFPEESAKTVEGPKCTTLLTWHEVEARALKHNANVQRPTS